MLHLDFKIMLVHAACSWVASARSTAIIVVVVVVAVVVVVVVVVVVAPVPVASHGFLDWLAACTM